MRGPDQQWKVKRNTMQENYKHLESTDTDTDKVTDAL